MATTSRESSVEEIVSLTQAAARLDRAGCEGERIAAQLGPRLAALDHVAWAAAEDELVAAGVPRATVCALGRECQHSNGRPGAESIRDHGLPAGHPIDTILRENDGIRGLADELLHLTEQAGAGNTMGLLERLRYLAAALSETRKHHARVLNVLLPHLERHGLQGPTRTLWAYYSGVRSRLAALHALLANAPASRGELQTALEPIVPALLKSLHLGMAREEQVVAPLLLRLLSDWEWAGVWHDSLSGGWCLVEPGKEYAPTDARYGEPEEAEFESPDCIRFAAGELSAQQVRGIFAALPFDLTFVDESDTVQFFTERPDRIFPRNLSVVGRKVQNCHPPSSLRLVNRILSDFREGRHDVAEFWFNRRDQFVHVRYFAVRDEVGAYLGTLEVAQDLTRLRKLEGEQRLLTDDAAGRAAEIRRGTGSAGYPSPTERLEPEANVVRAPRDPAGD